MKSGNRILAAAGVAFLAVGAYLAVPAGRRAQDFTLGDGCATPLRVLEPISTPAGSAILFHGLSANRLVMQDIGRWVAAQGLRVFILDFPGHGDSRQPFSYPRVDQCTDAAVVALLREHRISLERTVFVGHSMGAAVAVRLADRFPSAATIAISPAPMVLPHRLPANLFIVGAQFDPPPLRRSAEHLMEAAGGQRHGIEDFARHRAVQFLRVASASHTSLVLDPRVTRAAARWARDSLGILGPVVPPEGHPLLGTLLGVIGLFLLFPQAADLLLPHRDSGDAVAAPPSSARDALQRCGAASLLAIGVVTFWVPLRALRIETGAYLASFLLLCGIALLALEWPRARSGLRFNARAWAGASALGLVGVLCFGAWLSWQVTDLWPNAPRLWRLVPLVVFLWPYFAAEELILGLPGQSPARRRWAVFLSMRLELWLALLLTLLGFTNQHILILLFAPYLLVLSILQRCGADAVERRTRSPAAAALFNAILAAWFIAAVFPMV